MGGEAGGASLNFKKAAKESFLRSCGSCCYRFQQSHVVQASTKNQKRSISCKKISSETSGKSNACTSTSNKILCAICLDLLNYSSGASSGQAIFTAQCSHAFHFSCIASNVRYGSIACPICRAQWTQLPRDLNAGCSVQDNKSDPVLQILDESIANSRIQRRSFQQSAHYDDDDPVDTDNTSDHPLLDLSLFCEPLPHPTSGSCLIPSNHLSRSMSLTESPNHSPRNQAYLRVRLAHQPATDLVLVTSPNGPHLRLVKQSMVLVVSLLRHNDRLAIVTYSSAPSRVFRLRCMSSNGKRAALQVIDRLSYRGQAHPSEGIKKGEKILRDRVHKNPQSCILHLADAPSRSYHQLDMEIPIHVFHVGFGIGDVNRFIMQEFEEYLATILGGAIQKVQLRVRESSIIVRIGELRHGEERNIPLNLDDSRHICVEYSYIEGEENECIRTGEIAISMVDKRESAVEGRISSVESWDYHDVFMARRWAQRLHAYKS